jgi:UDP-N-acetylmuramoylalanine--D-glutamate ligase
MKTYAVFGLGKSGAATVNYLKARGDKVLAWDDGEAARKGIECTDPAQWDWREIDTLVLSPGIPLTHPEPHYIVRKAHAAAKPIICDIEILFQDNSDATFIGITGTNGKSTTTALTAHILTEAGYDVAVGGNLGTPALTLGKHKYYVIETSSYQLDLIDKARFDVAVWLNISPDHIDRHGNLEGYVKAKLKIFRNGTKFPIIAIDDEISKGISKQIENALPITKYNSIGTFPNLPGIHNMQNINAAYEAAKAVGVAHDKIMAAIKTFPGLEHRIEKVAEVKGVTYINDSKATNADSSAMALACYEDIYWIIGGKPKEGGISSLTEFFPRIKKAYIIGAATEEFAATLEGKVPYEKCGDLANATKKAAQEAKNGVVLLSPACASFDQFKSFEERGNLFKQYVSEIKNAS